MLTHCLAERRADTFPRVMDQDVAFRVLRTIAFVRCSSPDWRGSYGRFLSVRPILEHDTIAPVCTEVRSARPREPCGVQHVLVRLWAEVESWLRLFA